MADLFHNFEDIPFWCILVMLTHMSKTAFVLELLKYWTSKDLGEQTGCDKKTYKD